MPAAASKLAALDAEAEEKAEAAAPAATHKGAPAAHKAAKSSISSKGKKVAAAEMGAPAKHSATEKHSAADKKKAQKKTKAAPAEEEEEPVAVKPKVSILAGFLYTIFSQWSYLLLECCA